MNFSDYICVLSMSFYDFRVKRGGGGSRRPSLHHCNFQKCSIPCKMEQGERQRRIESPLSKKKLNSRQHRQKEETQKETNLQNVKSCPPPLSTAFPFFFFFLFACQGENKFWSCPPPHFFDPDYATEADSVELHVRPLHGC